MKRRAGLWLAIAAVLAANGAALRHAAANRSHPEPEVVLTERELPMQNSDKDDTGVSLRLSWGYLSFPDSQDWLDRAKLAELGFDVSANPSDDAVRQRYASQPPRRAFVALEYDGPAWQRYLTNHQRQIERFTPQQTSQQLEQIRMSSSRLVPIDAAVEASVLRRRYPDASRVLIVRAAVRMSYSSTAGWTWTGSLRPLGSDIHVPLPFSRQLNEVPRTVYPYGSAPRYRVRLRFGANREPWVVGVAIP